MSPVDQATFARFVLLVEAAYALGADRDPSLREMTEVLTVAFPSMTDDEMVARLRRVAEEDAA